MKEEKEQTVIEKTLLYLENYREMERYINEAVYIKGMSYEDIVRETGCGRNSPKKWCRVMIQRLSIKLFGAKAIENDKNGVKTG